MDYIYFLSSLEVNSSKHFFNSQQDFSRWLYASETNYDYEIKTYTPEETEFEEFSKLLEINQQHIWKKFTYLTHIPIVFKVQKEYFKSKGLVQEISSFVNNFLTLHQYFFNNYGIPSFKLDGRKILTKNIESESWTEVTYSSLQDTDFFEHLKESIVYGEGASDLVCSLAAEKIPLEPNWTLLIDGIRFFTKAILDKRLLVVVQVLRLR